MRRYLEVWRMPGARLLIVAGFLGRVPVAMLPLALLLVVKDRTGSYATAAVAVAAHTVALAIVAPVLGRLVDRLGPRPVLLGCGIAYPTALIALLGVLALRVPILAVYAAAAVAGAVFPVLSSTIRAVWNQIADGDAAVRQTAFALDSVSQEIVWVSGPLLVGAFTAIVSPAAALVLAAALSMVGTCTVALSGAVRRWRHRPVLEPGTRVGPLRAPGMIALLCGVAALMAGFGIVEVAVPAHADRNHAPALAGVLLAIWSLGSAVSGILFGTRRIARPLVEQWRWGLIAVMVALVPLVFASAWWVAPLLFVFGTAIAPTIIVMNGLVAEMAPDGTTTEAFTWVTTVAYGASSVGAAIGGVVVEMPVGVPGAFAAAGVAVAVAAASAQLGRVYGPPLVVRV